MDLNTKKQYLGKYALVRRELVRPDCCNLGFLLVLIGAGCFEPEQWLAKDNVSTVAANGHMQ